MQKHKHEIVQFGLNFRGVENMENVNILPDDTYRVESEIGSGAITPEFLCGVPLR